MLSVLGLKAPDHTTIWKRLSTERAKPVVPPQEAVVAIDSTGLSTTLRGEWIRDHWHKHRGFVKAHVAVDVLKLDVLGVIVIRRVLADAAYDRMTTSMFFGTRASRQASGPLVRIEAS